MVGIRPRPAVVDCYVPGVCMMAAEVVVRVVVVVVVAALAMVVVVVTGQLAGNVDSLIVWW